jgi:hypothetical protein
MTGPGKGKRVNCPHQQPHQGEQERGKKKKKKKKRALLTLGAK